MTAGVDRREGAGPPAGKVRNERRKEGRKEEVEECGDDSHGLTVLNSEISKMDKIEEKRSEWGRKRG